MLISKSVIKRELLITKLLESKTRDFIPSLNKLKNAINNKVRKLATKNPPKPYKTEFKNFLLLCLWPKIIPKFPIDIININSKINKIINRIIIKTILTF